MDSHTHQACQHLTILTKKITTKETKTFEITCSNNDGFNPTLYYIFKSLNIILKFMLTYSLLRQAMI